MSRKEEYWTLIQTLNETPAALDGAVDRARARARRSRAGRRFGIPLASLAGVAAAFAVLVNVSTPSPWPAKASPSSGSWPRRWPSSPASKQLWSTTISSPSSRPRQKTA